MAAVDAALLIYVLLCISLGDKQRGSVQLSHQVLQSYVISNQLELTVRMSQLWIEYT